MEKQNIQIEVNYAGCSSEKVMLFGFAVDEESLKRTIKAIFAVWGAEHLEEVDAFFGEEDESVWYWYERDSRQFSLERC